jgi:hypothetical protein
MSTDNNKWNGERPEQASKRVVDEEKTVDQKIKSRIIDTRKRVAKREDQIFVGEPLDEDITLSRPQKVNIWATSVRQFLRAIEPLLKSDEIENSEYYYEGIPIYEDTLYPPDGETLVYSKGGQDTITKEIIWSLFYDSEIDKRDLEKRTHFSSSFDPPEPEQIELHGLKSIIETETLSAEWTVPLNPGVLPGQDKYIAKPQITRPLQKKTLEQAVRVADTFLQEAGIGMEIGHQETDDTDDDPF